MFSFVQKLFKGYCYVSDDMALYKGGETDLHPWV